MDTSIGAPTLDLNALARFAAIVELGGFSPAARALGGPRQSLHRGVAHLEEVTGVRLLDRSARQIRPTAVLRSVNFLTGLRSPKGGAPAKLFQRSTKRPMGHWLVSLVSSFSVAKVPSVEPARCCNASSRSAKAEMLLSVSITNVVMVVLLVSAIHAGELVVRVDGHVFEIAAGNSRPSERRCNFVASCDAAQRDAVHAVVELLLEVAPAVELPA
ncbi:MAG TPA: LysR family transcriptional regulator, partial [Nannocystaceae bacterium]|nr:LysR family transcriptional regulator [Nannocystaceae bacterium]